MLCTDLMCDFIHGADSFKKLVVFWSYYLMERGNWHGTRDLPCTDYKYVCNELANTIINLILLWAEYCAKCKVPVTPINTPSSRKNTMHTYAALKKLHSESTTCLVKLWKQPGQEVPCLFLTASQGNLSPLIYLLSASSAVCTAIRKQSR